MQNHLLPRSARALVLLLVNSCFFFAPHLSAVHPVHLSLRFPVWNFADIEFLAVLLPYYFRQLAILDAHCSVLQSDHPSFRPR